MAATAVVIGARPLLRRVLAPALVLVGLAVPAAGQNTDALKRMTLEELLNVQVSTVSRVPEAALRTPAAIYVITRDDIRRAGATSIPDALRLAPGIHVARIDASRWAIGIRGFADRLARSMLVRIDGRAVYSPLFAGTYWEVQDTLLEDVERIEVIRGPGGTLWGANAVTGIINIVTRSAADTQGLVVTGSSGSSLHGVLGARYGGTVGNSGRYRVYGKGFRRGPQYHADGDDADDWWMTQGGFRFDWSGTGRHTVTVQGDAYTSRLGSRVALTSVDPPGLTILRRDVPASGANVLGRWTTALGTRSEVEAQAYYDRTTREDVPVAETRDTFDADFQHTLRGIGSHVLVWGAGYRVSSGRISTIGPTSFTPPERTDSLYSALVQDDFPLLSDSLRVSIGTKLEHNDYSGFEVQPSGRLTWAASPAHTVVGSITRAVRTPSRVETDYQTESLSDPRIPSFVRLERNPQFVSEKLIAYELGYRVRPSGTMYVTASTFLNQHRDLLSTEFLGARPEGAPPRLILPVTFGNSLHGHSYGAELTLDARLRPWWRWTTNYSVLEVEITRDPGSTDVSQEATYEGRIPRHLLQLQSSWDVTAAWSLDWMFRYVSRLSVGPVPSYATSDLRLGWQIAPHLELAIIGENLHEPRHREWPGEQVLIERSGYINLIWRAD